MDSLLWQLRHSSESFAFMRSHSRSARCLRSARNLSRVSMDPKMWPHTSFEACILRAILSVQLCGTWTVRAGRAHARAVGEVDRALQLLEDVGLHLVAAHAELLGVGGLQDRVESAPEEHAGDEPAERQEGEAERPRRREGLTDPIAQPRVAENPRDD